MNCNILNFGSGMFSKHRPRADAFYKPKCPSACPSVRLSVRMSVHVFTFEVPLKHLFAPTSQSRMSKIFRDLESLGKSNIKKWSQI